MYETGVLCAFLAWVWGTVFNTIYLNSRMARNLEKIGLRLSWASLEPKPLTGTYKRHGVVWKVGKFALIHGVNLVFVLTSWLYVAWTAGLMIYKFSKDSGKPVPVKELQWKLKNYDMSFDQIVQELYKVNSLGYESLEDYREQTLRDMSANDAA